MTQEDIRQVINAVQALDAKTAKEVEEARVRFLGKKGIITMLFEEFRNIPPEDKKLYGKELNMLKQQAIAKINELKSIAENNFACEISAEDLSLPGFEYELGSRHPVSIVRQEIIDIFRKFGYDVAEGPEIDDDYHVRAPLPQPPAAICRYFLRIYRPSESLLLRTHTSSIQCALWKVETAHPRNLPAAFSVMSHQRPRPLHLPSGGRALYRQRRQLCRPQAVHSPLRPRNVRRRYQDTYAPELLPFHRAVFRGGCFVQYLPRQGLQCLQGHRLAGDFRLRYGRPQCP